MMALLQRVTHAQVDISRETVACIDQGLLVLLGVQPADNEQSVQRMAQRLLGYRVFSDKDGKMNLSLQQVGGGLLLVPQFTLAADTHKGMRPSFHTAAEPSHGENLFNQLVVCAQSHHPTVQSGVFGADMQVSLTNDGPVSFLLTV